MIKRPLCLAAVLIFGIQLFLVGALQMAEDLKPSPLEQTVAEGERVTLSGRVYQREERPNYQIFYLTDVQIRRNKQIISESNILVYIRQNKTQKLKNQKSRDQASKMENRKEIMTGSKIKLEGEVRFFEKASNPGNFDRKLYYQKQGIHAAIWGEEAEVVDDTVWRIREGLTQIRMRWKTLLTDIMGESYGNCMSAILLGDKSGLDEDVKELYQKKGIGHIMAISGVHTSILGRNVSLRNPGNKAFVGAFLP